MKRARGADLVLKAMSSPTRAGADADRSVRDEKEGGGDSPPPVAGRADGSPAAGGSDVVGTPATPPEPVTKRTNYLKWDDYFMAVAVLSAHRSKGAFIFQIRLRRG